MKTYLKDYLINNKIILIKIIIIIIISSFIASLVTTGISIDLLDLAKDVIYSHKSGKEQHYYLEDFAISGYTRQGNTLITNTNDPIMELNNILNTEVQTLTINFTEPLKSNINIQIYYSNNGSSFNENQLILSMAKQGQTKSKIEINKFIEKIRIDIGTTSDIKIELKDIIINDNEDKILITDVLNNFLLSYKNSSFTGIWFDRFIICLIFFIFLGIHFVFNIKEMYNFMFKHRWIIAIIILVFLVSNKYHGDSMALYDTYVHIQEGQGSEYIEPVLGVPRPIRTDEWVVSTPNKLSSQFGDNAYSKYNNVMRGTKTLNSARGIYLGYSTLGKNPFSISYLFMDIEYAFSFEWYAPIILLFMISIELFMIISDNKKLLSVTGAFLIVFSSFYTWWSFPIQFLSAQSAIVFAYYFLNNNDFYKRIFYGIGTAISTSMFITNLYPAWQIPLGWTFLGVLISLIHDNWNKIITFKLKDRLIVLLSFLFFISLVISYFYDISEYTKIITHTVYPGKRFSNGGYSLNKIFYYFQSILYPYKDLGISRGSTSDAGVFLSFFPVPLICVTYLWIKERKKDILTSSLIIVTVILLLYSTFGFPSIITKITLLSYSLPRRVIDVIGYIQIYFIIIIFSKNNYKSSKFHPLVGLTIAVVTATISMFITIKSFPGYFSKEYAIIAVTIISIFCFCLLVDISEKIINKLLVGLIIISLITGLTVRPIMKGLDAIYSKPVFGKISEIVNKDKDSKWLTYGGGFMLSGYAVACGAPTINSVNTYPNLELWYSLDPNRVYEEVYNRYSHINVEFTSENTSMELIQEDYFKLNLSYEDLYKTKVKYILSLLKLDKKINSNIRFDLIYDGYGCYIYEIIYL